MVDRNVDLRFDGLDLFTENDLIFNFFGFFFLEDRDLILQSGFLLSQSLLLLPHRVEIGGMCHGRRSKKQDRKQQSR